MKTTIFLLIICILQTGFSSAAQAKEKKEMTNYRLSVQINPDSSSISGVAEIEHPTDSVFFLAKGLVIQSVHANRKDLSFNKKTGPPNVYSNEYSIGLLPDKLTINYSGQIKPEDFPKSISNMNLMTSNALELTDLIDWHPRFKQTDPFRWSLQAEVPSNLGLVTNS